jgi:glucose/arabinose dehydrogenase
VVDRLVAAAAAAVLLTGCSGSPSPPGTGESPSSPIPISGNERIAWDVSAGAERIEHYEYVIYVDDVPQSLSEVACQQGRSESIFTCSALLPRMPVGTHRLEIATKEADGSQAESERSSPLHVTVMATKGTSAARRSSSVVTTLDGVRFVVETLATGLDAPSALAVAPDGRVFVAQRSGEVVVWQGGQSISLALSLGDALRAGDLGLIGMTLHPEYSTNGRVFIAYTARDRVGSIVNRIIRFRDLNNVFGEPAVLLEDSVSSPPPRTPRVRIGQDLKVYLAFPVDDQTAAESLATYAGKILRLNEDGTTPSDNRALSPIIASGHTLIGGFDWQPETGRFWLAEGDAIATDVLTLFSLTRPRRASLRPVAFSLEPPLDPSGAVFYSKALLPAFANDLFVASLAGQHVRRIRFNARDLSSIDSTERLLDGQYGRISDVVVGPDGALYFCTSNRSTASALSGDDRLMRLIPANQSR